jgi:hypothetical protein
MKKYSIIVIISLFTGISYAQTLNWASLTPENKHILNLNTGLSFGVNFGVAYSYQTSTKLFPLLTTFDFSMPSGKTVLDDYKTRIGTQIRLFELNNFRFSAKIQGVYRQTTLDYVRLRNFGSDFAGTIGYYRPKWFLAGDMGFDKAIVTHFKHSAVYKSQFENVQDGWYEPATGGNFYYGLQAGFSLKRTDIYLKAGKLLTQDFKTTPMLPFYAELGVTRKF